MFFTRRLTPARFCDTDRKLMCMRNPSGEALELIGCKQETYGRHSAGSGPVNKGKNTRSSSVRPRGRVAKSTVKGGNEISNITRPRDEVSGAEYDLGQRAVRREGSLEKAPHRLRAERDRRKARNKRIAVISGLSIVGLLVVLVAAGALYLNYLQSGLNKGVEKSAKLNLNLKQSAPQEPYTMLVMGFDKRATDTVYRSDTMLLTRIDAQRKKVWMISLPRDYRVDVPGHGVQKLNAAYSLGQEKLAIQTVEKLTGVTINHFMAVNFKGFHKIVNSIGGVEIDVPVAIDDTKADYSKSKEFHEIDAGPQILNGGQALVFVRSRAYPDGDFSRMRNQQAFFKALADQVTKVSGSKLPGIVTATVPYLSTDMSLMQLIRTAQDLRSIGSKNVYTDTLPGEWRTPFIYPDEEAKAELLRRFKKGQIIGAEAIAAEEKAKKKAAESKLDPSKITVSVNNGTTRVGIAKQGASVLKARGFNLPSEPGNMPNQSVYEKTMIVYKTSKSAAELLAKYLQPNIKLVESRGMYAYDTELLLICGKDWDLTKVPVAEVKTEE